MDKQTKNGTRKTAYLLVKIVIFRDAAKNTDDYCDTELSSVARIKKTGRFVLLRQSAV